MAWGVWPTGGVPRQPGGVEGRDPPTPTPTPGGGSDPAGIVLLRSRIAQQLRELQRQRSHGFTPAPSSSPSTDPSPDLRLLHELRQKEQALRQQWMEMTRRVRSLAVRPPPSWSDASMTDFVHVAGLGAVVFESAPLEAIFALRHAELRPGLPCESACFAGDDAPTTRHFAARIESEVIACASVMLAPREGRDAWQLRGMATRRDARGRGVGRRMLGHIERALTQSPPVLSVWCNARAEAVAFYQRLGWRVVSDRFDILGVGPHYQMVRTLPAAM